MAQGLWICHRNTEEFDGKAYQKLYDTLSLRGKEKADTTRNELHWKQRILAYSLLEHNGQDAAELYEPWEMGREGRRFSISHSGNLVWVVMADMPVGIDVEEITRLTLERVRRLAESHFFTGQEQKRLAEATVEEFLYVWTFKEAMTKLTGVPLAEMLGRIDYFQMKEKAVRQKEWLLWSVDGATYAVKQWVEDGGIVTLCQQVKAGNEAAGETEP